MSKQLAEEALQRACDHLCIARANITLKLVRSMRVYGSAQIIGPAATVKVELKQSDAQLLNTVAHEARHCWQRWAKVVAVDYPTGRVHWRGTEFSPLPQSYRKRPYHLDPTEDDARGYARWFTRHFYGLDSFQLEVKSERIRALLLD